MSTYKCDCCEKLFEAREADRKRGWARFCSKRCKAIKQVKETGIAGPHYAAKGMKVKEMKRGEYAPSQFDDDEYDVHPFSSEGLGQWV